VPGWQGDIIGFAGDPLEDITAVRRVAFVMKAAASARTLLRERYSEIQPVNY
jgi:hypothetical protein